MPRNQRELIAEPTEKAQPTAVVRAADERLYELDLGDENELPAILIERGWRIVRVLRGNEPTNGR